MSPAETLANKVWNYCHVLRNAGLSYGDYLEQLTYLIFLKMAHEYTLPPHKRDFGIPKGFDWPSLTSRKGEELEGHYIKLLQKLGKEEGLLGQIFVKSQNRIQEPVHLASIIEMIDREKWVILESDVKGSIYENLLERNAQDIKSGAGQYFTPRPLIKAMVECVQPEPNRTICDPACGTGGFFLAAYDYLTDSDHCKLNATQRRNLKSKTFYGNEIVSDTRRLCLMNMYLHNIGEVGGNVNVSNTDSLVADPGDRYDYVLTNPPFGKKGSLTVTNEDGKEEKETSSYNRQDFIATTSNKQLNFMQHILTILKSNGQAAIVVPDNVLFEGGAGEKVRQALLEKTDLHTILRLPTGIFYANGVKANVLFFDNKPAAKKPWTKDVWYYDLRTNCHFTLKTKPLTFDDLNDFISCYKPGERQTRRQTWSLKKQDGRWRKFSYKEILNRDKTSLDIFWLKDKSLSDLDNLPDPEELAEDIINNLEAALASFKEISNEIEA
ncbi:N-6 DNA methylase [Poriferisphaera sp. WC338]|uniref:class I SAM-dependent DNA methyltransferase n=1 Tax=Poriferisphaera sp. WC338 TaxID=3425129 RepID=UPI003D812FCD